MIYIAILIAVIAIHGIAHLTEPFLHSLINRLYIESKRIEVEIETKGE